MTGQEFKDLILESVDEAHREEAVVWLEKIEKEFERIANATNWPIEKVRSCYGLFKIGMGLGQDGEFLEKSET